MKRVLSLVLALVLVLGMIPTFAAEKTGGEELKALGLLSGNENGDLMEDQTLERQEFAKIIAQLNGALDEAAAYVTPGTFADFDKVEGWARNYVAYAEEQGWMTGKTGNIFDPAAELKSQELLVVLLRVLGYDDTWSKAFETAAEVGLVAEEITAITRGDAFELIWTAVSEVKMADSDMTLGVHLGVLEPAKPVVKDLAVDEVVADNLKTLTIIFNKEVDADTITATNVKVTRGSTVLTADRTVLEDGKSVAVVFTTPANLAQSDTIKVTIENVADLDGAKIAKFEQAYIVNDTKVPTAVSVLALNPKQVEVTFSEPVNYDYAIFTLLNDIKIDGTSVIAKAESNKVTNKVLFTLSTALTEGTHSLEVKGVADFAGFTAPTATLSFAVVKDETAPVAVSATVKSKDVVVVKFDEPIDVNYRGSFEIDNVAVATTVWKDSKTVELTVPQVGGLSIGAIVEVKVEYKDQRDIMGNQVKNWVTVVTKVADDTTLPTVELTSVSTANKITLTFNKTMATAGTIELLNKDGVVVETETVGVIGATFKANTDNKVLEVTFAALASVNPTDYSVRIKDMKDATVRSNALATTTIAFKSVDSKLPTVTGTYVVTPFVSTPADANDYKKDTITIFFSEAMDVASIENLANYYLGSTPFSVDANAVSAKAAADAKSVVITYWNARTLTDGASQIKVYAAKDATGNAVDLAANAAIKGTTVTLAVNTVEATDANTIKVTFNTNVKSVEPATFVLVNTASGAAVTNFVSSTISSTNAAVVTFKTATAISTSASIYSVKVNSPASISSIYNTTLTANAQTVVSDLVVPTLVSVATAKDTTGAVVSNAITFTFSEALNTGAAAAFKAGLVVKDADGAVVLYNANNSTVVYDGTKVTVTFAGTDFTAIKGALTAPANVSFKVSFPTGFGIVDMYANQLQPVADQAVTIHVNF